MTILPLITSKKKPDCCYLAMIVRRPGCLSGDPWIFCPIREWFSLIGYQNVNIMVTTVDQKVAAVKGGGYGLG